MSQRSTSRKEYRAAKRSLGGTRLGAPCPAATEGTGRTLLGASPSRAPATGVGSSHQRARHSLPRPLGAREGQEDLLGYPCVKGTRAVDVARRHSYELVPLQGGSVDVK